MIKVEFFDTGRFTSLKSDWERLEKGRDMTVFQSYDWYSRLNEYYIKTQAEKQGACVYAVAYESGKASMIAPLFIKKRGVSFKGFGMAGGVYLLGMWGFTDYLNFIYDDFSGGCFTAICEAAAEKYGVNVFRFCQIVKGTRTDAFLKQQYPYNLQSVSVCVKITVGGDLKEYTGGLTKNVRQNIRTARNRASKEGKAISIKVLEACTEQEASELYRIYTERSDVLNRIKMGEGIKKLVLSAANARYNLKLKKNLRRYNYITEGLQTGKNNFILLCYIGESVAGFCYGLKSGDSDITIMIVCFKEEYKRFSPGMLGIYGYLEERCRAGRPVTMDLTRGTESYKYDLGGIEHEIVSYEFTL